MLNADQSSLPKEKPHVNFEYVLCNSTINSQQSTGAVMATDAALSNFLSSAMDELSQAYFGTADPNFQGEKDPDLSAQHTFEWFLQEMQWAAQDQPWGDKQTPLEMQAIQSAYSANNTMMQQNVNIINGASQASSQQASSDNSALQGMVTLASTGSSSISYAANLSQQTM